MTANEMRELLADYDTYVAALNETCRKLGVRSPLFQRNMWNEKDSSSREPREVRDEITYKIGEAFARETAIHHEATR